MKKHLNLLKSLCFLLIAVMVLSLAPGAVSAAEGVQQPEEQVTVSEQAADDVAENLTVEEADSEPG